MSSYNNRRWELSVDGVVLIAATGGRQFKCTFEVLNDFGGYTSYCDLAIFNLSSDTANKVLKRGSLLSLRAGYADSIDTIFAGTIRNILRERQGPDTITRLICRGGKLPGEQGQVNVTLGENAKITDIIRACVAVTGYPVVMDDDQFSDIAPYPYGYVLGGDPLMYLDNLAETHGFNYVIENERMIIVRRGKARQGDTHIISQFTGMEGIPEITEVGIDVTTRLNPKIKIGGKFIVESKLATFNFSNLYFVDIPPTAGQGEYDIFRVSFSGDSWGDTWSTKITGYRPVTP
jgi:hypothetical protein